MYASLSNRAIIRNYIAFVTFQPNIIVFTNLTLDGVMQSPGRPDEDTRDGFKHGGWARPFAAMQEAGDVLANVGAVLFGRRTYEGFYAFWPNQPENPFTTFFNNIQKYVASTTLTAPLLRLLAKRVAGSGFALEHVRRELHYRGIA